VLNIHSVVKKISGANYLSLKSQMLRAAMSIPTNIVEGVGQHTAREFARFIRISLNSSNELEYHLQLARDFELIARSEFEGLLDQTIRVRKMLHGLHRSLARCSVNAGPTSSPRSLRGAGIDASRNEQRVQLESQE
jgi:four helix bundle protein